MDIQKLIERAKLIGELKTDSSGKKTNYSLLFNDDGSGAVYRKVGSTPIEKQLEFSDLNVLIGKIKNIADVEAKFKLGQQVTVISKQRDETYDSPVIGTVGTVVKIRNGKVMFMWFGNDEVARNWWINNTDLQ